MDAVKIAGTVVNRDFLARFQCDGTIQGMAGKAQQHVWSRMLADDPTTTEKQMLHERKTKDERQVVVQCGR